MKTEFEIKMYDIDPDTIRHKLFEIWASCQHPRRKMRRKVYDVASSWETTSYFRVRDEWDRITTTFKSVAKDPQDINATRECEVIVSDFDTMCQIYEELWYSAKSYQETYRETRKIEKNNLTGEIVIDRRPKLRPFIEIEADDENTVREICTLLWYQYEQWDFGAVDSLHEKYAWIAKDEINTTKRLVFEDE